MTSKNEVFTALENVIDPEIGLDFVELGLIYDVDILPNSSDPDKDDVYVTYSLTSPGCPVAPQINGMIISEVIKISRVAKVFPNLVWSPVWNPEEMMTDDAKFTLGF